MPPPRPKGAGYTAGVPSTRPNSNTPMSERQQVALLMQMTATSTPDVPRTHAKKNEFKKGEVELEENDSVEKQSETSETGTCRDKPALDDLNVEHKKESLDASSVQSGPAGTKRSFSDVDDDEECDADADDLKKKKRKDVDTTKEAKGTLNMKITSRFEKNVKQASASAKGPTVAVKCNAGSSERELLDQPKITELESENETSDDLKSGDSLYNGGLKVPPLKIVIPQQNCSIDTEGNVLRTGKIATSRNAALPYVVSTSNEASDKDCLTQSNSPHESPLKSNSNSTAPAIDEKNVKLLNEEKNLRVLRSSHRGGGISNVERGSNNSSPQMQSSSPSPASCSNANETTDTKGGTFTNTSSSPMQTTNQTFEQETIVNLPSPSTSSTSSSKEVNTTSNADLHPRKRKIRSKHDDGNTKNSNVASNSSNADAATVPAETHPHDFPFTNGFQMYMNIRRQIEKKWKNLYPVKPRPPQGYNDYLLTKRSYLLSENDVQTEITVPTTVTENMKSIFILQEKQRQSLMKRHTVEREKLCLNVEQEIIRVHSKAARNMSGQSAPYSVCTFLKDDEVYNMLTPEQDEKDKSARCRFNGRLLLSWLQDVDDKWEKIKESMLLRHHNEAESLHAIQLMDWEISLKKHNLCEFGFEANVEKDHVPIVHVSDDFDLLPA